MRRTTIIIFLFLIFFSIACKKESKQDQSLTIEEYRELGLPDNNVIWSYNDYVNTCKVLSNLKVFYPLSLPKKDSKKSGEYFMRIIDSENFSFLLDETIPLRERAEMIQKYVDIQGSLITSYTDLDNTKQNYHRELIDLYIFGLTIAQNMLDLGQRINESIDEEDIEMQYGYLSIQNMYIKMILFVLDNQHKSYFFIEADLEKLTKFVFESIMLNKDWMEAPAREDIEQSLQKVINNTTSVFIREEYQKLTETL